MPQGARRISIAALVAFALLLTACAPEGGPAETASASSVAPQPSSTPSPSASATPSPTTVFPTACDDLLTDADVTAVIGVPFRLAAQRPAGALPGPVARKAADTAVRTLQCLWLSEQPSDGNVIVRVYDLEVSDRERLTEALWVSPDYVQAEIAGVPAFHAEVAVDLAVRQIVYAFVDDIWVALDAPLTQVQVTALTEQVILRMTG